MCGILAVLWSFQEGRSSIQDVSRIREMGRFFSKQEPCKLIRDEAVFVGQDKGTP